MAPKQITTMIAMRSFLTMGARSRELTSQRITSVAGMHAVGTFCIFCHGESAVYQLISRTHYETFVPTVFFLAN